MGGMGFSLLGYIVIMDENYYVLYVIKRWGSSKIVWVWVGMPKAS